jgi:acyl carrier protein
MQSKYLDKKLKNIFLQELKIKVKSTSKIYDFKSWDSLGNFNVLLRCEKEFNIKFTSKEFTSLDSFKEIEKVVKKK